MICVWETVLLLRFVTTEARKSDEKEGETERERGRQHVLKEREGRRELYWHVIVEMKC